MAKKEDPKTEIEEIFDKHGNKTTIYYPINHPNAPSNRKEKPCEKVSSKK